MKLTEKIREGIVAGRCGGFTGWQSWLKDQKGQMSTIMTVVAGAITLVLGVVIYEAVYTANVPDAPTNVSTAAYNETYAAFTNSASIWYSSMDLVVIGFIVLAAVFILSIVQRLR